METIQQLLQGRADLIAKARAMHEAAEKEGRDLNTEEQSQFQALMSEANQKQDKVKALRQQNENAESRKRLLSAFDNQELGTPSSIADSMPQTKEVKAVKYRGKTIKIRGDAAIRNSPDGVEAFNQYLLGNGFDARFVPQFKSAMQGDVPSRGGYFMAPETMTYELLQYLDEDLWIRRLARVFPDVRSSLGAVKRKTKMGNFAWGPELANTTDDATLAYGKKRLEPRVLTGSIVVSVALLTTSDNAGEVFLEEMNRGTSEFMEQAYLAGDGIDKPLGIFPESEDGIPASRNVASGSNTGCTMDGLKLAKGALKQKWRRKGTGWLVHRDAYTKISLLKDGQSSYYWQPSVKEGEPDRLLSYPVYESEFAPNTYTAGKPFAMFGWWPSYWIADGPWFDLKILDQTKARQGLIEYLVRIWTDGAPTIDEAFVRVVCGS